jgi:hypothetical protein
MATTKARVIASPVVSRYKRKDFNPTRPSALISPMPQTPQMNSHCYGDRPAIR